MLTTKRSEANERLLKILFSAIDIKKLLKNIERKENKSPRDLIEKNFTIDIVIDNFDEFSKEEQKKYKTELIEYNLFELISHENIQKDENIEKLKEEAKLYREAFTEIGVNLN